MSRPKLGEQISAVRKAAAIIHGAEKAPDVTREREYLASCVDAAIVTLEWLRDHEDAVKAAVRKDGGQ